jgi:DNA polymerase II large subunit
MGVATDMCNRYKMNEYLQSRIESLMTELKLTFKEEKKEQSTLTEFID